MEFLNLVTQTKNLVAVAEAKVMTEFAIEVKYIFFLFIEFQWRKHPY